MVLLLYKNKTQQHTSHEVIAQRKILRACPLKVYRVRDDAVGWEYVSNLLTEWYKFVTRELQSRDSAVHFHRPIFVMPM